MIRIMAFSSLERLAPSLPAALATKFASVRRLSMLRCDIALAARGGNSQLSGRELGEGSQPLAAAHVYDIENTVFFSLARLML
jgi:hypothetical protein